MSAGRQPSTPPSGHHLWLVQARPFLRGQGWSDLAFGVQASTFRLEVRPRCESGSPVSPCGPLGAPGLRRVAWLVIWPLSCALLWPGGSGGQALSPTREGRERGPLLNPPKLYLRPQTEQPPRQGQECRTRAADGTAWRPRSKPPQRRLTAWDGDTSQKLGGVSAGQVVYSSQHPALVTGQKQLGWAGPGSRSEVGGQAAPGQEGGRVGCVSEERSVRTVLPGVPGTARPGRKALGRLLTLLLPAPCPPWGLVLSGSGWQAFSHHLVSHSHKHRGCLMLTSHPESGCQSKSGLACILPMSRHGFLCYRHGNPWELQSGTDPSPLST